MHVPSVERRALKTAIEGIIGPVLVLALLAGCGMIGGGGSSGPPTREPTATMSLGVGDPAEGRKLFHDNATDPPDDFVACKTCHYTDAEQGILVGPNMEGIADRAGSRIEGMSATEYLHRSINDHDEFIVEGFEEGVMISIVGDDFGNILEPQDMDHLVAYLLTLEEGVADRGADPNATPTPQVAETGEHLVADGDGAIVAEEGFLQFQPPDGWETLSFDGKMTTRPPDAGFESGPVIGLKTGTLAGMNFPNVRLSTITTTEAFFSVMFERFQAETFGIELEEPEARTIGGAPGRVAAFHGWGFGDIEGDVSGQIAVALVGDVEEDDAPVLVMIGLATPPEQWTVSGAFETLLSSVRFDVAGSDHEQTSQIVPLHPHYDETAAYRVILASASSTGAHPGNSHQPYQEDRPEADRSEGPRFGCVHCHVTHDVEMLHDSNPSCNTCHSGTPYQRHCVDCHSIHDVDIPHEVNSPSCASCHPSGIPGEGVDIQHAVVSFLAYIFHEI